MMMRFLVAGLFILFFPAVLLAQATGQVLSIGFDNHLRPDCWAPMLIQLTSQTPESAVYQIQIVQEDIDRDRVSYSQPISLSGNHEGSAAANSEKFWAYFIPESTDDGLPDALNSNFSLADLNKRVKVYLCNSSGKQLATLPIYSTVSIVDPKRRLGGEERSQKLVLFVISGDQPHLPDYSKYKGILEDMVAVPVQLENLPNNVLGYEGVDAIVWMNADARKLTGGTMSSTLEAIQTWVHRGGHLVVCQPADEPGRITPFVSMLPVSAGVEAQDLPIPMQDLKDMTVLRRIMGRGDDRDWDRVVVKAGRAAPTPDAKVEEWMQWTDGDTVSQTPWLARRGVGLGTVSWVAIDLGNRSIRSHSGWRYVWDRVFDWNNPRVPEDFKWTSDAPNPWANNNGQSYDLGATLIQGMEHTNKAAYMVTLAVFFFIAYWLIAGPGVYFLLVSRKRAHLSWFAFAASALLATGLTIAIVKLIVRGPPELRHISVARYAGGETDGIIRSRFGLYIPQDGIQSIELKNTAPDEISCIYPFAEHPQFVSSDDSFPAYFEYQIPVRDAHSTDPVVVNIPYRSTSKKLQAEWAGEIKNRVETAAGTNIVRLVPSSEGYLNGTLVNHTAYDLRDVYIAFKSPSPITYGKPSESADDEDYLIYQPLWKKDTPLDLSTLMKNANIMKLDTDGALRPGMGQTVYGRLRGGVSDSWSRYWNHAGQSVEKQLDLAYPMMALFDRIAPSPTSQGEGTFHAELFHRGARELNLSTAVSSGRLVIFALADNGGTDSLPLPFPLTVSDSPLEAKNDRGMILEEFVLPLDRSRASPAPVSHKIDPPSTRRVH